jgi:HPt (histidine-containing phosphotransfer) domain-containing protein
VRVYLTVKAIDAMKLAEPGGRYDVADAIVPGFGVRVNARGKSYTLTARFPGSTHPTRRTIAAVDEIDLATARDKARACLVKIRKGDKPPSVRVLRVVTPKAETFEQVVTKFLEQHVHRNSLRTAHEVERIIPCAHREKSNAKTLGLTRLALDVIDSQPQRDDSEFIFAGLGATPIDGLSKMKRALDERMEELNGAPIPPWVVHDLRRTARSLLARAGVRPDICKRVLGHANPGVWGVYDRYSYEDEKTQALSKLSDLIERIIAPDTKVANPIPVRFRQHMQPSELRVSA